MHEVTEALYQALTADSTLTTALGGHPIAYGMIPKDQALPFLLVQVASAIEENLTPTRSVRLVYLIKAIGYPSNTAQTITNRVDALLIANTLEVTGWGNVVAKRISLVQYLENGPAGQPLLHYGAEYQLTLAVKT